LRLVASAARASSLPIFFSAFAASLRTAWKTSPFRRGLQQRDAFSASSRSAQLLSSQHAADGVAPELLLEHVVRQA